MHVEPWVIVSVVALIVTAWITTLLVSKNRGVIGRFKSDEVSIDVKPPKNNGGKKRKNEPRK